MAKKRIYVVTTAVDDDLNTTTVKLVSAKTVLGAIAHVVRKSIKGRLASQADLVMYIGEGAKVEEADDGKE